METFKAGLETGCVTTFVFHSEGDQWALLAAWRGLAVFRALLLRHGDSLVDADSGREIGEVVAVDSAAAARALETRVAARQRGRRPGPAQEREQQPQRLGAGAAAAEEVLGAVAALDSGPSGGAVASGAAGDIGGVGTADGEWCLVMDARDWKVIPAENLVALAGHPAGLSSSAVALRLMAVAGSAVEARLMLEALEAGTGGVLLRTDDATQVRALASYVARRAAEESARPDQRLPLSRAVVTAVRPLGMGDRACVDMAGLLQPGEGLLVGSFARCLALVHSECEESDYIASRPFRVNAGPVHAYVSTPGGRTRYLSELASGSEVLVADPAGRSRTAIVGRVKIERRPLVLVELETPATSSSESGFAGNVRHSLMLQNAETVKLVGPAPSPAQPPTGVGHQPDPSPGRCHIQGVTADSREPHFAARPSSEACSKAGDGDGDSGVVPKSAEAGPPTRPPPDMNGDLASEAGRGCLRAAATGGSGAGGPGNSGAKWWRALPVSSLRPGDEVFVVLQAAARHTGIAIQEFIVEK